MRRYLPPEALLTVRCGLGVYKIAMMITRILTIGAAVAAAAAVTSLAQAQQGYPLPPPGYSTAPPYPPGGYVVDERRQPPGARPDFDALEDDEDDAPAPQRSTALPPPGPVLSPNDPRYGANRP